MRIADSLAAYFDQSYQQELTRFADSTYSLSEHIQSENERARQGTNAKAVSLCVLSCILLVSGIVSMFVVRTGHYELTSLQHVVLSPKPWTLERVCSEQSAFAVLQHLLEKHKCGEMGLFLSAMDKLRAKYPLSACLSPKPSKPVLIVDVTQGTQQTVRVGESEGFRADAKEKEEKEKQKEKERGDERAKERRERERSAESKQEVKSGKVVTRPAELVFVKEKEKVKEQQVTGKAEEPTGGETEREVERARHADVPWVDRMDAKETETELFWEDVEKVFKEFISSGSQNCVGASEHQMSIIADAVTRRDKQSALNALLDVRSGVFDLVKANYYRRLIVSEDFQRFLSQWNEKSVARVMEKTDMVPVNKDKSRTVSA